MAANSRFAVAVHCLLALAYFGEEGATAELLASSVNTNPVVLRRLLKLLQRQGLVEIRQGKGGGVRLLRQPASITLAEVYTAVEADGVIFAQHAASPNQECLVSCNVKQALEPVFSAASDAVIATLSKTKLSDLLESIRQN
jgi:Rrf2 family protein